MRHFDPGALYRSTVGFDRLFSLFDDGGNSATNGSYPRYNIEKTGDNTYRITVAVAGFSESDLTVELNETTLVVRGEKNPAVENQKNEILFQGIAARSFERRFQLAEGLEVVSAHLENGLLNVDLLREIPEKQKPRSIPILTPEQTRRTIESQS